MTPNSTHTIWQEKYPTCISLKTLSPWLPKFHLFHSSISRFPDIPDFRTFKLPALFWKKCTKWTQNDLGMLENKSIPCACHMHPPPPQDQIFNHYAQLDPFLSYGPIYEKSVELPQNDLDCLTSKVPMCVPHTALRTIFSSASLYDERFSRKFRFLNFALSAV